MFRKLSTNQTKFWGGGGGYIGITMSVCLSRETLALAMTSELKEIGLTYYTCIPCGKTFLLVPNIFSAPAL